MKILYTKVMSLSMLRLLSLLPTLSRLDFSPTNEELTEVGKSFAVEGCGNHLVIPENFVETLPPYVEGSKTDYNAGMYIHTIVCFMGITSIVTSFFCISAPIVKENPQTVEFCEKLGIENPFKPKGRLCQLQVQSIY